MVTLNSHGPTFSLSFCLRNNKVSGQDWAGILNGLFLILLKSQNSQKATTAATTF